jgi:peptide/nickel transport system permease protein
MPGGSAMREYLIKRLVLLIPTFLGITLVVYSVLLMLPGDPVDVLLGQEYDAQIAKQLRAEWGLDQPVIVQYIKWLQHIVRGDWGRSLFSRKPVFDEVMAKLPLTLELIALALFFEMVISVPAGVVSAVKPYTWWDYAASTFALVGVSIPSFFLGILLFLTFGLWLGWLPVQGYVPLRESVGENLRHLILPTLALGVARTAILTRLIRGSMLEVIHQEYVMTARSKGLAEALVINKHALKNALIPAVTVLGLQVGFLVGGAIIIEKLFALPGIGSYGIDAITNRDYPQVLGFILISALVFQLANLAVDLVYCFLDPRIRYGKAEM